MASSLLVSAVLLLKIHAWLLLSFFFFFFFFNFYYFTRIYALGVLQRKKYFMWNFLLWVHSPAH